MLHNNNLKTFFLFPQKLVFEELAEKLVSEQNEAFVLNNHVEFKDALKIFNEKTIAFINIDSVLSEQEWKEYLREMIDDPHFEKVRFGILSFNDDESLIDYYTNVLHIKCGYHILSKRNDKYERDILQLVSQYREKEGHKVLRLDFDRRDPVKFEIDIKGLKLQGNVDALSSAAMGITLDNDKMLKPAMELTKLTLVYRDITCNLIGTVIGNSKLNRNQFIIKFQKLFEDFHQNTLFGIIFHVLNNRLQEMVK